MAFKPQRLLVLEPFCGPSALYRRVASRNQIQCDYCGARHTASNGVANGGQNFPPLTISGTKPPIVVSVVETMYGMRP